MNIMVACSHLLIVLNCSVNFIIYCWKVNSIARKQNPKVWYQFWQSTTRKKRHLPLANCGSRYKPIHKFKLFSCVGCEVISVQTGSTALNWWSRIGAAVLTQCKISEAFCPSCECHVKPLCPYSFSITSFVQYNRPSLPVLFWGVA